MAKAKVAKSYAEDWEHNSAKYPEKVGVCDHCGTKDDIKLAFDQIHWICINAKVCINRWSRQRGRTGE